jgi:hypothetical protein
VTYAQVVVLLLNKVDALEEVYIEHQGAVRERANSFAYARMPGVRKHLFLFMESVEIFGAIVMCEL